MRSKHRRKRRCAFRGSGDDWCADVSRKARKEFGVTDDPREAGYILADGTMLDFSGKHAGGEPGERGYDHRVIALVTGRSGTDGMYEFMRRCCAIRFSLVGWRHPRVAVVEGYAPCRPTAQQARTLRDIEPFTDGFAAELSDDHGTVDSATGVDAREATDTLTPANGGLAGGRRRRYRSPRGRST